MLCLVLWSSCCCVVVFTLKKNRVCIQNVPVYAGTTRKRVSTCSLGAGKRGDVLNVHTVTCGVDTRRRGEGEGEGGVVVSLVF